MAETSKIAWTKSTFNPWIGCTKVSPGCEHCYASVSTPTRTRGIQWGAGQARIRTSVSNWNLPLRWNKQAAATGEFWPVFCSSLADVFDNEVDPMWRRHLFKLIAETPNLTWLLLTKRIGNVSEMVRSAARGDAYAMCATWAHGTPPPNVWIGATIVNQAEADRDIPKLLQVPAAKRFVSYEPALGPVDWAKWLPGCYECAVECGWRSGNPPSIESCIGCGARSASFGEECDSCGGTEFEHICPDCDEKVVNGHPDTPCLDWIIVGGESDQPGMKARPFDIHWARSTVRQCKEAGVPVFVKQLGSNVAPVSEADRTGWRLDPKTAEATPILALRDRAGADPAEWPEDLRVQEFPS